MKENFEKNTSSGQKKHRKRNKKTNKIKTKTQKLVKRNNNQVQMLCKIEEKSRYVANQKPNTQTKK